MKKDDWNKLVWKLHFFEEQLKKAWIKIWELHPDQHPEAVKIFKKNFEELKKEKK